MTEEKIPITNWTDIERTRKPKKSWSMKKVRGYTAWLYHLPTGNAVAFLNPDGSRTRDRTFGAFCKRWENKLKQN